MNRIMFVVTFLVALSLGAVLREAASSQVAQLPDGGDFQGHLLDGRLQGAGEIRWRNGQYYRGEFKAGLYQGQGTMMFADGSRYEGEFSKGQPEGQGTLYLHDGDRYVGQFHQSRMQGQGRYERGDAVYEGQFDQDHFTGQGSLTRKGKLVYSGGFDDWEFNGQGQYFADDGSVWKGTFDHGRMTGKGEYRDVDGERYVGEFKNWQYDGHGVLYATNGDRYEGDFRYGQYNGEGTMYLHQPRHDVSQYHGTWRFGRLVKSDVPAFIDHTDSKIEQALYSENSRLDKQLTALKPGTPGHTDLYFLGVAGDGSQHVFGRELKFVYGQLSKRYDLAGHSVLLVNDRDRIGEATMATRISVRRAIDAIARNMNRDEDVLLLYMTSHGSRQHDFVLNQKGMRLPYLSARTLAQMLDESGIKYQMVIMSACYSGGIIPLVKGPDRLVMTSAAADRTSFGCSDDSKMTYFGRALFSEAFPQHKDWVSTFDIARDWIQHKEQAEKITPSKPQIAVGADIRQKLAQLPLKQT